MARAKKRASAPSRATGRRGVTLHPISKGRYGPLRKKLLVMRDDLLKTVAKYKLEPGGLQGDVGDEADQATNSVEKETRFGLTEIERTKLDQIEAALRKMEKGTYSLCESCQRPISKARIKAVPYARYCITCQATVEHISL